MLTKLTLSEIERELEKLPEWRLDNGKLFKEFIFQSFPRAFGFMATIAMIAETMDHHPEWLNVHQTVKIWLSSHEVDGISANDIKLANQIESVNR